MSIEVKAWKLIVCGSARGVAWSGRRSTCSFPHGTGIRNDTVRGIAVHAQTHIELKRCILVVILIDLLIDDRQFIVQVLQILFCGETFAQVETRSVGCGKYLANCGFECAEYICIGLWSHGGKGLGYRSCIGHDGSGIRCMQLVVFVVEKMYRYGCLLLVVPWDCMNRFEDG